MSKKITFVMLVATLLCSCVTALSPEAATVEILSSTRPDSSKACTFVGPISEHARGHGTIPANTASATNDARAVAARLGANAIVIVETNESLFGTTVRAEAFRCEGRQ